MNNTEPKPCADCGEPLPAEELTPEATGSVICRACFCRLNREWGQRPPLLAVGQLVEAQVNLPPWRVIEALEDQIADIKRALRSGCLTDEERTALEREIFNLRRGVASFLEQVFGAFSEYMEQQRRELFASLREPINLD